MQTALLPNPRGFEADPFGYSALAWHKWGLLLTANGFPTDITKAPTSEDLKDPVLWLSHANALSEASACLVKNAPAFESFPSELRAICHSQYHAVALMLVGYSLEVCLKAMILLKLGAEEFTKQEKSHFHHRLDELATFIPQLNDKERAILRGLSHFVTWAGRYPDPGSKWTGKAVDVLKISEDHQVSAKDLFALSLKVMQYTQLVIE